ncbi:MAG: gamma-glutamyl-phosphate reductase, partial [Rhodoluna sp.]
MTSAQQIMQATKNVASQLAQASTATKNEVLRHIASLLPIRADEIIQANNEDIARAQADGVSESTQDRIRLDHARIQAIADAVLEIVGLPDPIGDVVQGKTLPNLLKLTQIRVPLGVIGVIYEARPNVTIDIAALGIKSGNATILRGGRAAQSTNNVLVKLLQDALQHSGLSGELIQSLDEFGREGSVEMMRAIGLIDVLIPRGGAGLIKSV